MSVWTSIYLLASLVSPDSCCCFWISAQSSMTKVRAVHAPSTPAVVVVVPIPHIPFILHFSHTFPYVCIYPPPTCYAWSVQRRDASVARASFNFRQTLAAHLRVSPSLSPSLSPSSFLVHRRLLLPPFGSSFALGLRCKALLFLAQRWAV